MNWKKQQWRARPQPLAEDPAVANIADKPSMLPRAELHDAPLMEADDGKGRAEKHAIYELPAEMEMPELQANEKAASFL